MGKYRYRLFFAAKEGMKGIYLINPREGEWSGGEDIYFVASPDEVPQGAEGVIDLSFEPGDGHLRALAALQPALIAVGAVVLTLDALPEGFVRINDWPGCSKGGYLEGAATGEPTRERAAAIFQRLGRTVEWVPDQAGFFTARVVASIINEAYLALEEGVSTEAEIDTALKLGTAYPYGPFEWAALIGKERVAALLQALEREHGRYRPAAGLIS